MPDRMGNSLPKGGGGDPEKQLPAPFTDAAVFVAVEKQVSANTDSPCSDSEAMSGTAIILMLGASFFSKEPGHVLCMILRSIRHQPRCL